VSNGADGTDATNHDRGEKARFAIFFLISFFGFGLDTALLNVLVTVGGLRGSFESMAAKAISSVCASFVMFLMHRRWTYRDRPGPFFSELGRYSLVRSSAVALGIGLFSLFRWLLNELLADWVSPGQANVWSANLAQMATSAIILALSYFAHGHFTFSRAFAHAMHGERDVRVDRSRGHPRPAR
jgi:putative flippase GtrA